MRPVAACGPSYDYRPFRSVKPLFALVTVGFLGCGSDSDGTPGGPSEPTNPAPAVTQLVPSQATVGDPAVVVTIYGSGFVDGSVARWDDEDRPTTFLNATRLTVALQASDLEREAVVPLSVRTPPPGGGISEAVDFLVSTESEPPPPPPGNPTPMLESVAPEFAPRGSDDLSITVTGTNFVPESVVRWNTFHMETTYVSSTELRGIILAPWMNSGSDGSVSVHNPPPGGGTSAEFEFEISEPLRGIELKSNDLVYDPARERIYASIPSDAAAHGNSVVAIDPSLPAVVASLVVGSEPALLALSADGRSLYVSIEGESAIRRINLSSFTADSPFQMRGAGWSDPQGVYAVEDMFVVTGQPEVLVASIMDTNLSPRHVGVVVFDDGTPRDTASLGMEGSINNRIEPSSVADTVYGYDNETSRAHFQKLVITAGGIREVASTPDLISDFDVDMTYLDGQMFASNGAVFDPAQGIALGQLGVLGLLGPDTAEHRLYHVRVGASVVGAIHSATLTSAGSGDVAGGHTAVGSLIRWGDHGLAVRATNWILIWENDNLIP